jgi:succinate dehydrogenase/fumarate reductase flavoprotein subunit
MEDIRTISTDLLVIGSGVAGLRAAAAAAEAGVGVTVVSKGPSASPEIMGFNVPVCREDSITQYIEDMEQSGCGICNSKLVRLLAENVSGEISYMESIGLSFDRKENGEYDAIHTLGTKYPRLIHYKSNTGSREMVLLKKRCLDLGVTFSVPVDIFGLLKDGGRVIGAFGEDARKKEPVRYIAGAVVLAAGGCGAMHRVSTYPRAILGDGYAMALRAGAKLTDMEFQQFEPCCFIWPEKIAGKVIATTLLRHGASLLNGEGREFMQDYGLTRENAQKSTLSRAMVSEVNAGRGTPHGGIYYNMTMMSPKFLYEDHAIFTRPAVEMGMDLTREMPEMYPAAHTCLGGVRVDENCGAGVQALFACGEVIGGLHGANRIGGSAGAETVVFGALAGKSAAAYIKEGRGLPSEEAVSRAWRAESAKLNAILAGGGKGVDIGEIRSALEMLISDNLGITRTEKGLVGAKKEIARLRAALEEASAGSMDEAAAVYHCENMLLVASVQVEASLMRTESRGVFFREDFPHRDDRNWNKNILAGEEAGKMVLNVCDCIKE